MIELQGAAAFDALVLVRGAYLAPSLVLI